MGKRPARHLALGGLFSDGMQMVVRSMCARLWFMAAASLVAACDTSDYPKHSPGAELQENALGLRISADTLRFITHNLEGILRQNLSVDESGEYVLISLPEASDDSADTFCDETLRWPGQVPACKYKVRLRDGCLGPGKQNPETHRCEPSYADRPRESMRSSIRIRVADLAQHIRLEMEDPSGLSSGGFRLIIEDLSIDADIGLYANIGSILGKKIGAFACRYFSPGGVQALKIERIDVAIRPKIELKNGVPSLFATSEARDIRLGELSLSAEPVADPACLSQAQGALSCAEACELVGSVINVAVDGFNFINDILKPALPSIVTPVANAALSFLWGNPLEMGFAIPTKDLKFIPKGAGQDIQVMASAQAGAFAVDQKGSGEDDPTRGTSIGLSLGAYSALSPCVENPVMPPGFLHSSAPALDGSIALPDPLLASGATYDEPYHLGFSIGEGFFNQLAYALRNSGMLCISLGSEPGGALATGSFVPNAGLLYLLAPPLAALAPANAPIFFRLKPGNAPSVRFGSGRMSGKDAKGNPVRESLMTLTLFDTGVEFHLFAWDRYIRTFALNIDVVVGLSLYPTTDGKLMLSIDSIKADNIVEIFNELLPNYDFSKITEVLFSILSTQLSSSSLTFELPLRSGLHQFLGEELSVRLLDVRSEGSARDSLGIYVKLCTLADELDPTNRACSLQGPSAAREASEIAARVVALDEVEGTVDLALTPPGPGAYEYQAAFDSQIFGAFFSPDDAGVLRIQNGLLHMLGKHRLRIRPRRAGQPVDLNAHQAELELIVDPESPRVRIEGTGGLRSIVAEDLVTPPERMRFQLIDAESESAWIEYDAAQRALRAADDEAFVLARDEAGNISADPRLLSRADDDRANAPRGCAGAPAQPLPLLVLLFVRRRRF